MSTFQDSLDAAVRAASDAAAAAKGFVTPPAGSAAGWPALTGTSNWTMWAADSGTTNPTNLGRVHFWPVLVGRSCTLTAARVQCTTLGASATAKIGLYASDSGSQPTGNPLFNSSVSGASTGWKTATGLSVALTPGVYWTAFLPLTAAATWTAQAMTVPVLSDDSTNRTFRDSFPDVSYTDLPSGWSRAATDGWASSPNPVHFQWRFAA